MLLCLAEKIGDILSGPFSRKWRKKESTSGAWLVP
jgi:hypothetical protein